MKEITRVDHRPVQTGSEPATLNASLQTSKKVDTDKEIAVHPNRSAHRTPANAKRKRCLTNSEQPCKKAGGGRKDEPGPTRPCPQRGSAITRACECRTAMLNGVTIPKHVGAKDAEHGKRHTALTQERSQAEITGKFL